MIEWLRDILSGPGFLIGWALLMAPCLGAVLLDLSRNNTHLMPLMKLVWFFTVLYSGPLGLAVYWTSGRKQISRDTIWRRAWRSVSHCYSGCGMGEIAGVIIAAGLLALGTWWVAAITFALAYVAGYGLTVGPLMQEGVPLRTALWDAFLAETPSITVMEVVAIGADILLAGGAHMSEPIFWSGLIFSLSLGLFAAYPVNVLLIHYGVKEGMMDPRDTEHAHG